MSLKLIIKATDCKPVFQIHDLNLSLYFESFSSLIIDILINMNIDMDEYE